MITDHQREMRHKCAWCACDEWMHANQCLKHAIRFEPDVYDEEETCIVGGHPCVYSETCGFEESRTPITKPTEAEIAAYKSGVRRERILYSLDAISKELVRLKDLLSEEFQSATRNERNVSTVD